jgi:hypothetical protein
LAVDFSVERILPFIRQGQPTTICREYGNGWKFTRDGIESPNPLHEGDKCDGLFNSRLPRMNQPGLCWTKYGQLL